MPVNCTLRISFMVYKHTRTHTHTNVQWLYSTVSCLNAVVYVSQVIIDGGQSDHVLERSPSCFTFVDFFAIKVGEKTKCFQNVMHNWRVVHPKQPLCRSLSFWGFYNRLQSKIGILYHTDTLFCGMQDYVIEAIKWKIGFTPIINMICHGFPLNNKVSSLHRSLGSKFSMERRLPPQIKIKQYPNGCGFPQYKAEGWLSGKGVVESAGNRAIKNELEQEVLKPYSVPATKNAYWFFAAISKWAFCM